MYENIRVASPGGHEAEHHLEKTESLDYTASAEQWFDNFLEWREQQDPSTYLSTASSLAPSPIRVSGRRSAIENFMVRSLNSIDPDTIDDLMGISKSVKYLARIGNKFYGRGNYSDRREQLFEEFSEAGLDEFAHLYTRLANVVNIIPDRSLERSGFSKLCRAIGGVAFLALAEQDQKDITQIGFSLRAGYDFAVTYPLVDDLLHDSDYLRNLSSDSNHDFNESITELLTTGTTSGVNIPRNSITDELIECFEDVLEIFPHNKNDELYRTLLALQEAQVADSNKSRETSDYGHNDYIQYILKAGLTRVVPLIIARGNDGEPLQSATAQRILGLGLRTQLHDDLMDAQDDLSDGTVTPATLHMTGRRGEESLNPGELFVDALFYSLEHDYGGCDQKKAARVLLGTAAHVFSGLGTEKFNQLQMRGGYNDLIECMVKRYSTSKIEGSLQKKLDKVANERSKTHKKMDVYLLDTKERVETQIDNYVDNASEEFSEIFRHTLSGSAKRIRPALAYMTADGFGIDRKFIDKYALSVELLHTASLVFDDMQDKSITRRGKEAVYVAYGESAAQNAALAMVFDALKIISSVDSDHGLNGRLSSYVSESLGQSGMCLGQFKDNKLVGKESVSIEEVDNISRLKTGLAIEASIVGAAMINKVSSADLDTLKTFSYHCGIAFQVKDDILDVTGNPKTIGKDCGSDAKNGKPTYVSVLGLSKAEEKLDFHVQQALDAISELPTNVSTQKYKELVEHIRDRDS